MESWSRAILEWVNCLDVLDVRIHDLKELRDGKFYAKLIKMLSNKESDNTQEDRDLVSRFIKDTYPEFFGKNDENEGNCQEIHVASLLLLHSSQEPKLHRPMCIKLNHETQMKIKSFLEKVLDYGSCVNKDNINTAIMETVDDLVRTPPVTPKMRPLKDFFNSPATTVRKNYNKVMDERTREIRSLKAELETERFEKADIQEDLEIQRQKNLSLQQKLQEKIAEMKKMREESMRFETPQSSKKRKDVKTPKNQSCIKLNEMEEEITLLKSEIINLQDENQSLVRKLASVERNCVMFKERSKMNERNLETLLIEVDLKDQEIEELKNHNEELRSHIQEMRRQTIAEESFEMEMTATSSSNVSLNGSEVLSSVIDIQLQEAKEQSKVFKSQVEDLNQRLESVKGDYLILQQSNKTLEAEVNLLHTTKQELAEVKKEIRKYIERSNILEKEKLHFQEQTARFEKLSLSKGKLLQDSEHKNKILMIDFLNIESKLKITEDLLNKESNRVRDLNALVSQKSAALETQSSRYNDLAQKHVILNQENLKILEDNQKLKNLVSAKEESLSQTQQQIKEYELDLKNLKSKLKNEQDLLRLEKTRMEDFEFTIKQVKLEHERTSQAQLSKYHDLEEKYVNLELEKVNLLQEMKDLNFRIVLNDNLLKKSSEQNQNLGFDLKELNDKLEIMQQGLAGERKTVEELESVITRMETEKQEFTESQFLKYQNLEVEYTNLKKEKLNLVNDIRDLNTIVSSKEELLNQCLKEKANIESNLKNLTDKLIDIENSLSQEKTRVADLESTVTLLKQENEEAFQTQLTRYQALQRIHTILEQEQINLVAEVDRLNSLISSKQELLKQSEEQNEKFAIDVRDLNNNLQIAQGLLSVEKNRVHDLESTLSQTKLHHEETVQKQKLKYKELEKMYLNSEQDKIKLFQDNEKLTLKIADNESLLTQTQIEKGELILELGVLNDEIQCTKDLLSDEKFKVGNLESMVTLMKQEKEETYQNQFMSYQALEKKHMDLEREKLDLLQHTENLENQLASRDKLLLKSEQQVAKLEGNFCDLRDELKTVQSELDTAITKVKSLESTLSQTKLESDIIIRSNENFQAEISSLKSAKADLYKAKEELQKQSEELEQEKSRLLEEVKELKVHVSSKEEFSRQTQQQNEDLHSKLKDLDEEVKLVQNLLIAESTMVKELDSTIAHIKQEKKEALQSQLMSFQALDKKHTNVEQEKSDLLKHTENLKIQLSSKDELLLKSEQQVVKLEGDLCDSKNELKLLQNKLDLATTKVESLESAITQSTFETDKIIQSNENLHAEMSSLESAKKDLYETNEKLREQNEELMQGKSRLLEEIDELKIRVSSREELRAQITQQNETLHSKLKDLDKEVKSMQNLLSAERAMVKELQSTIAHIKQDKEETLQSQLISFQALEKEHANIKQEKLNLLKDIENLRIQLSSKEELLLKSQQQVAKLEGDLCDSKDELNTMQSELDTFTTKIKSLESAITQEKLKTDEIIQKNENLQTEISSLRSTKDDLYEAKEKLCKQREELKQEGSRLLEEIEELKTHIYSKEELLTQTQRQNETFQFRLKDLNEEVKSVQNLLSAESTTVKELESSIIHIQQEKEETLRGQLMNFQALEKKYIDVEREKSDLLKHTENLKNQLLSKEELLLRMQQQVAKLKDDLCDTNDELKTIQDKLEVAKTEVKSLESVIAESTSEIKNIIQANENLQAEMSSLESTKDDLYGADEKLHKQTKDLEQEKTGLLEQIEELKTHVSSKKELLSQTQQQNEDLNLKLKDLNEEVKLAQKLLMAKGTRIKDLESIVAETEAERKETLSIIEKLKTENDEHRNLIESCTLILIELVKHSSLLIGNEIINDNESTILDLSKQLKTLINSMELIHNTKDSDLKNFKDVVSTLNRTVAKLQTDMIHFEEMKSKADQIISEYLKEIADLKLIAKEKEALSENVDKLTKELYDERSKINSLNEEKRLLGHNLLDVKNALTLLKNEKFILVENIRNHNEEFSNKMTKISEVILKIQGQIELDNKMIINLREGKALLDSKYEEETKMRTELEMKCGALETDNKSQTKERKELKDKLNTIRIRNAKLEKNLDELRKENKKLEIERSTANELSKVEELNASISKLQLQIHELEVEKIELSKRPTEQDFDSRLKGVHLEYDQKLEKIKQKMKTAYNEQISKVNRDQERLMQEKLSAQRVKMEEQCRKHAEEITKYKDHVTKLSSDYWDVGEKLLVEKQQKEQLTQQLQNLRERYQYERTCIANSANSQPGSIARSKTASLDRREFPTTNREEASSAVRTVQTIKEESTTSARRESIQSVQTLQGMGNAFKAEDEEGEVFNTNYLADMKAGRCSLAPDLDRLSVLQLRNAQCKPHLKSSYPAETQFQPGSFTEEEIKSGSALEDVFNDSLSQSLLPGEKTKKRDRTQTLYKRPGPPTPSKNGGRLSLQGNELKSPNSRILREKNVERRSTATPRRLKDLFGASSRRQDENVSGTPKSRRLSSIFRKPK